ncbi:hypothetical protein BDY21DRAFT_355743 [Lineolata rhizophorae]|uniref:Uncharacterized protein n=1 Tax=Lineolata rhizophorae TaxID=578093 RepID=A0A6A6NNP5_9PEZI|nr:hypothetical protein BDY21DRAFT_355743 [Lineolata rhizophorae]
MHINKNKPCPTPPIRLSVPVSRSRGKNAQQRRKVSPPTHFPKRPKNGSPLERNAIPCTQPSPFQRLPKPAPTQRRT